MEDDWIDIFGGQDVTVRLARRQAPAVVTFDFFESGSERPAPYFRWLFKTMDLTHVHIGARWNHWYQTPEMAPAVAAVRNAASPRLAFGASMGGCGALRHGLALGVDAVMAGAPQISVDPRDPPHDPRWAETGLEFPPLTAIPRAVVAFDPAEALDRAHAGIAAGLGAELLEVPDSGHAPIDRLTTQGRLQPLLSRLLSDQAREGERSGAEPSAA